MAENDKTKTAQAVNRDNYYILLELESDPPVTDSGRIKAALRAKKQEWTRWQDNPGKRNAGLNYLGQAAEIEKLMLDPVLRDIESAEARKIKASMLTQFEAELRVLESKGYILPREASAITVKYKAYGITGESVAKYAKCPVAEAPPQRGGDDGEVIDRVTARNIQRNLKILGEPTLYTFLGEPPYSSIKKLQVAAEQKRRSAAAQGSKTSQATISQELAGICVSMFETIQSKQKYDRYLKISKYPAVGELIDEENARSQYISPDVLLRIVNFAVEKHGIKILDAEEYIKGYCTAYDIPLDNRGISINCPACQNRTPRGSTVCVVCAQPLNGTCPSCGDGFEGGPVVCASCGFKVGEMAKALSHLSDAENALIESNWSVAQRGLQYVKKYWPSHPKLEVLEKRAALLEERYASYIESIDDCVKHGQLYAAQELIAEADARRLRLPAAQVRPVAGQIAAFEYKLERLQENGAEPDIDELLRLSVEVTDSMELSRLLSRYPPEPPSVFTATVDDTQVSLTWGLSPSPYAITYFLVRKNGSPALTAFDGDLIYEGSANTFIDTDAPPLVNFYYSVFSKRAGTYSKTGAAAAPVLIVPEIKNLRVLPMDGGAQLNWDFNPDVREVMIWRKLGGDAPTQQGDGILLENDRLDGFADSKLKNDVEYWYYIVAAYVVDGNRITSSGILDSVVPRKTVAPIEEFNFAPTDREGEYIVSWNAAQHSDIILFCSSKKPDFRTGDIFMVEELLTSYRKLDLDYKRTDSAQFQLALSGGLYLFAAAVFGRFATVCEPRYVISLADVENLTCDQLGGNLYLNMKWPVGIADIAVTYRFDRFTKAPEETGATTLYCSRKKYDFDAGVFIKDPEPNVYYITVFSVFTAPDGHKAYSRGVELTINNQPQQEIFYQFAYKKRRFSETGILDVTITSQDDFVMPRAVIVGKIGRLPLSRADGLPLFELEKELRVSGSVSIQFATTTLPPNIYIRMFMHDDLMYEKYRLLPASRMKIT